MLPERPDTVSTLASGPEDADEHQERPDSVTKAPHTAILGLAKSSADARVQLVHGSMSPVVGDPPAADVAGIERSDQHVDGDIDVCLSGAARSASSQPPSWSASLVARERRLADVQAPGTGEGFDMPGGAQRDAFVMSRWRHFRRSSLGEESAPLS
jgi:hypothetical protein